jgi:hypothetical protein
MTEAYPLAWPDGWPRTPAAEQKSSHTFKRQQDTGRGFRMGEPWTFAAARDALYEELFKHTGGRPFVLSSDFVLNSRGEPAGSRGRPADQGIAVYFRRGGRDYVMACDRYDKAEGNMRSLTLALEAMRQLERHGGGTMTERAFQGFVALPPPKSCWEVLGLTSGATAADVQAAWRRRIGDVHPDQGGSQAAAAELNAARDDALRRLAGPNP